jgi:CRP-like cAMP-binding protein
VVREYYLHDDGTEHTRGFGMPGDAFGSLSDRLQGRASAVFVRAEAKSRVVFISWSRVEALARKSRAWERLAAAIVQDLYLRKSVREYELLALDAMARYQSTRARLPGLERKVPATLLASYLGITNVHLSRLRRRLKG